MTHNRLTRRPRGPRHSRLPLPITIALVLAVGIVAFLILNAYFYGQSVMILDQRVVIADIEDFPQFIRDCSDDPASSDEIVTMRDDPGGNCLFLRLQLLVRFIYDKKGTQIGQILIDGDDFKLVSGNQASTAVLLGEGYAARAEDGSEQLVMRSLTLRRGADGIEVADAGDASRLDDPTVGDVLRGVKRLQGAASISGRGSRGVLDWVRAPLEERSAIIQPPALAGCVWRAERTQNKLDAFRSAEAICLFPLPPPGSTATLVVFDDQQSAVAVNVP